MDREDVVYMCNGILLSLKKKEILPVVTIWIEISQAEKDKYYRISLTCGI